MIEVTELPESQLEKSPTYRRFKDADGTCSKCSEHTSLLSPCCSASVFFEGSFHHYDELWDRIEDELKAIGEEFVHERED